MGRCPHVSFVVSTRPFALRMLFKDSVRKHVGGAFAQSPNARGLCRDSQKSNRSVNGKCSCRYTCLLIAAQGVVIVSALLTYWKALKALHACSRCAEMSSADTMRLKSQGTQHGIDVYIIPATNLPVIVTSRIQDRFCPGIRLRAGADGSEDV